MTYIAALPLALYAVLIGADVLERSDLAVAVLLIVEAIAIAITLRALYRRYVACHRRQQAHNARTA